jgi:HlyD family secretion protein
VGTVERTTFELAAPVSETIFELPAEVGDHVPAGEVVVRLDDETARAELEAAEAMLAAAAATLVAAEREFVRFENLRGKRAASATTLDEARRVRDEALAMAAERRARVTQAHKRLQDLTIRSPAAGILDQSPFDLGERVPEGVVVAVVIADEEPWVRVWLPARILAQAGAVAGAQVQVEGYQQRFRGILRDVAHEPEFTPHYALTERESAHLVYRARIALQDAPSDLRPGLAARVWLELEP